MLMTVLRNLMQPSRTRKPDDHPPLPPNLRGVISHNASRCTACGTCAFVCAPKAITLASVDGGAAWRFFAGQCAFCGLCERYCPTKAISNRTLQPTVSSDQSSHHSESIMPYQPCPRCGKPHIPLPDAAPNELMCSDCRRKLASERIRDAFIGHREGDHGNK